jgi:regulator of replication initiation timing
MEMELDVPTELNQAFYDLNEPEPFNFEFEPEYNAVNDPFTIKQDPAFSPEDTLFDTPSASPLPVVPDETLVFSPVPIEIDGHGEDVLFEDAVAAEAPFSGNVLEMDDSLNSQSPSDGSYNESRDSDSDAQPKRGRKRKAPAAANEKRSRMRFDPGHVIPKDQLPKMSAEELEEYAQHIQDSNLSTGEKNEIRKQLRLVKNRESAQASRLRKKNYIDDLEHRVSLLQSENSNLRQNISSLHNENTQLKSEVVYLKGVVNNGGLSKVLSQGATFFSKLSQQQQQQQQGGKPSVPAITARSAGVVLMVVLFSVGLMFNSQGVANNALPFKSAFHEAKPGRVLNHVNYKPTSEVRDVLAVLEESDAPTQRIRQLVEKQRAMPDSDSHKILDERRAPKQLEARPAAMESNSKDSSDASPITDWKPNTTYLLCPDVQKLTPPTDIKSDPSLPSQISLLIPAHSLAVGAGDSDNGSGRADTLLEVTCRVVDITSRAYIASKAL